MKIQLRPFLASCAVVILLLIQFKPMVVYATISPWEGNPWEGNEWNKNSWDGVTWESEDRGKDGFNSNPSVTTNSKKDIDNTSTSEIPSESKAYDGFKFAGTMINESFVFAKDMLKAEALGELTVVKRLAGFKAFGWDAALLGVKTLTKGTFFEGSAEFTYDTRDIFKNAGPARIALSKSWNSIVSSKMLSKYGAM